MRESSTLCAAGVAALLALLVPASGCSPADTASSSDTTTSTSTTTTSNSMSSGGGGGGGGTTTSSDTTTSTTTSTTTGTPQPPVYPKPCNAIYSQDILPTFELTIHQDTWDQLYQEWLHGHENELAGIDPNPEHPLDVFKYENEVITNASIRLRGNTIWWLDEAKMQFEIEFDTYDSSGRFRGLRRIDFDAAASNVSFLRDRLGLAMLRDAGLAAPCANNARIVVNGVYYGLFTSLEKIDKSFLSRNYPDNDGDLWKRVGWELETNKNSATPDRLDALKASQSVADMEAYLDMEEATLEWATEAVMPDNDGAWAGGYNFYLYDDPTGGKFLIIPYDLDSTFTRVPFDADPVTYLKPMDHGRPWYDLMVGDPVWLAKYKAKIPWVLENAYDVDVLQSRIDAWSAQIFTAVEQDVNKPFTTEAHLEKVQEKRQYVAERAAFVKNWICYDQGGTDVDGDGNCDPPM